MASHLLLWLCSRYGLGDHRESREISVCLRASQILHTHDDDYIVHPPHAPSTVNKKVSSHVVRHMTANALHPVLSTYIPGHNFGLNMSLDTPHLGRTLQLN